MNILDRANKIVNERAEEKERMYGPFDESMERATVIFNAMTGLNVEPQVMYKALIALKLSREYYSHKEDNLLDACAFIGALNNYEEDLINVKDSDDTLNNINKELAHVKINEKLNDIKNDVDGINSVLNENQKDFVEKLTWGANQSAIWGDPNYSTQNSKVY